MRVFVITSDHYMWALKPFIYLFQQYWSELQEVVVAGFSMPDFDLPENFRFHSIARQNYPAKKWSNALIKFLQDMPDDHFVLMLEDYWLCRTVDHRGVQACWEYIKEKPDVLRIDLTDDRLYAGGRVDVEGWGSYDIIETPESTPYQMSTQAGIWNRKLMLDLLEPGKSAWEVEIHTKPPSKMRVLGTRQAPVRYANAILKGKVQEDEIKRIPQPHRDVIKQWIPDT